jgi:precorrin-8X/cobalt-precorrin-8 methylmutase
METTKRKRTREEVRAAVRETIRRKKEWIEQTNKEFEMIRNGDISPAGIIGVPVGFVNVVEAKELILETEVPHIVARGRKGGSNVAAAIVNALLYELDPSRGIQKI